MNTLSLECVRPETEARAGGLADRRTALPAPVEGRCPPGAAPPTHAAPTRGLCWALRAVPRLPFLPGPPLSPPDQGRCVAPCGTHDLCPSHNKACQASLPRVSHSTPKATGLSHRTDLGEAREETVTNSKVFQIKGRQVQSPAPPRAVGKHRRSHVADRGLKKQGGRPAEQTTATLAGRDSDLPHRP